MQLTTAEAIVRYLVAQRTEIDGLDMPLFPGVFAIFGHGNVTCLGQALYDARGELPTWRGQNEQGMALAAVGFAKATRRRQIMVVTTSIGPGALNLVTAAGVAHANRLPVLMIAGDTFQHRISDPVLQQVEHFGDPTITANDAFRPVVRYWDRITRPEQVIRSLPNAVATMLDPAGCGPALVALPQDVQAELFDFPDELFATVMHEIARPRAATSQIRRAVDTLRGAQRPLIVAGGGVHYSGAESALAQFAIARGIPVVETMAGKASVPAAHPRYTGPVGVTGCDAANSLAAASDVVVAVGTRLQDFTTGSWTAFNPSACFIGINVNGFDARKRATVPVVGDALDTLSEIDGALGAWLAPQAWTDMATAAAVSFNEYIDTVSATSDAQLPTYAQVVGAIDRLAAESDYAVTAAGGLPGEMNNVWRAKAESTFDCEYGFSCMGYEISGAWGAKIAMPHREVLSFVGDGSYLMLNADLYSSVLCGHKLIVIVCDNGGYAVIDRLQTGQGGASFRTMLGDGPIPSDRRVDFAAHARSMGCGAVTVTTIVELESAFNQARRAGGTQVIVIRTDPDAWTGGGAFWEVGVPTRSDRDQVTAARAAIDAGKSTQRLF